MSLWKAITGLINNTDYRTARIDASTHSLQIIDYAHHEAHAGSAFYYHDVIALGNGAAQDYLLTTPDTTKWAHFGLAIDANDGGFVSEIYEAGDRTGTTLQTALNRNRNSATPATLTVHKDKSGGTTDGTRIFWKRHGGAKGDDGQAGTAEERILKQNTKYILRVTNLLTTTNNVTIVLRWYEHTDKN